MAEVPMSQVLDNVERSLTSGDPPAEVAKFAPQKYRGLGSASSLATIHTDIRTKTLTGLDEDIRRVEDHLTQLKAIRDDLKRIIG